MKYAFSKFFCASWSNYTTHSINVMYQADEVYNGSLPQYYANIPLKWYINSPLGHCLVKGALPWCGTIGSIIVILVLNKCTSGFMSKSPSQRSKIALFNFGESHPLFM